MPKIKERILLVLYMPLTFLTKKFKEKFKKKMTLEASKVE